jgi:hypothetical protein
MSTAYVVKSRNTDAAEGRKVAGDLSAASHRSAAIHDDSILADNRGIATIGTRSTT